MTASWPTGVLLLTLQFCASWLILLLGPALEYRFERRPAGLGIQM
jgi:hypothetical protein